jgi:hypothetical protein
MLELTQNRYQHAANQIGPDVSTLLDVGCRDAIFRKFIREDIRYYGIDIIAGDNVDQVCNLEKGLPFEDKKFDVVTALDVLEHTDNIWFSFDELARVARNKLMLIFPNQYHWSLRLQFLKGGEMAKYRLPSEPIVDRHRWLVSYNGAKSFCLRMAEKHSFTLTEYMVPGALRNLPVDLLFTPFSKNLGVWSTLFVFSRRN